MTEKNPNNGRLVLGVASLAAVLATAATVWAFMRRRSQRGAEPALASPDAPAGGEGHPDDAWRAQTMSGSSQ